MFRVKKQNVQIKKFNNSAHLLSHLTGTQKREAKQERYSWWLKTLKFLSSFSLCYPQNVGDVSSRPSKKAVAAELYLLTADWTSDKHLTNFHQSHRNSRREGRGELPLVSFSFIVPLRAFPSTSLPNHWLLLVLLSKFCFQTRCSPWFLVTPHRAQLVKRHDLDYSSSVKASHVLESRDASSLHRILERS